MNRATGETVDLPELTTSSGPLRRLWFRLVLWWRWNRKVKRHGHRDH